MKKVLKWVAEHVQPIIKVRNGSDVEFSSNDIKRPLKAFKREKDNFIAGIKFKFKF